MSPVFRPRRRAEEFAALVEEAAVPGRQVEVMAGSDQARLLGVVDDLRVQSAAAPTPRPAFAAALRDRLVAEAATGLPGPGTAPPVPVAPRTGRERRLVAAATVTIVLGGTVGMASAAEAALPGQALYPVKRGIEEAQVDLAGSAFTRGRLLLENASTRLDEVQGLLDSGPVTRATQIPHTLQDFSQQAGEGADLMLRSYRSTGNPDAVAKVRQFAATQLHTLKHFAAVTPPKAHEDLVVAASTLGDIDGNARVACVDCGADIPPLQVPRTLKHHTDAQAALQLTAASGVVTTVVTDLPPQRPGDAAAGIALTDPAPPPAPAPDTALPPGDPATTAATPAAEPPADPAATTAPVTTDPAPETPATSAPAPTAAAPPTPSVSAPSTPAPSDPAPVPPTPSVSAPSTPAPSDPAPVEPTPSPAAPSDPAPSDPTPGQPTPSAAVQPTPLSPDPAPSAAAPSAQSGGADEAPGWVSSAVKSPQDPEGE